MGDINRMRAQTLLAADDLDGVVLFRPEAFRYATGLAAGVATMWGKAGSAIALIPADPGSNIGAIMSDHAAVGSSALDIRTHRIWIDSVNATGATSIADIDHAYLAAGNRGPRPESFDQDVCLRLLADLLAERGLSRSRLGIDLDFLPAADFSALQAAIPDVRWCDASHHLRQLRLSKNGREIERLRRAARCAEAGLDALVLSARPGSSVSELSAAWQAGARQAARSHGYSLSGHWDYISVGPDITDTSAVLEQGSLIKADVGTLVDGYSSDGARSFVVGTPSPLARSIYEALLEAFLNGVALLSPGHRLGEVYDTMLATMRRRGFHEYERGHFGHSVGGAAGIEEWPFISRGNDLVIEAGMVLALEAPFYAQGLGALMIEEQFLITEQGADSMNRLPRHLRSVGV